MHKNSEEHLDELSRAVIKEKRAVKLSAIFTAVSLALGILWIYYSFNEVGKLGLKSRELTGQIDQKSKELGETEKELKEAREALLAINPLLEKYGVLKEKLTAENLNSGLVKQSLEANREIQELISRNPKRRNSVTVLYFPKDVDASKVQAAITEFGFSLRTAKSLRPDLPTNLIAFGQKKVDPEDAKLVAYTLMRAGIEIKALCRTSISSMAAIVQVIGDDRLLDKPPLNVNQVRNKKEFIQCPANDSSAPWPENY